MRAEQRRKQLLERYNRGRLDDRTRVLVIIGECVVSDEAVQLPNHIRSALRVGATPAEIWEVILQAHIYAGMPRMIKAMRIYRDLMRDLGLLEGTEPPFRGDAREPEPEPEPGAQRARGARRRAAPPGDGGRGRRTSRRGTRVGADR
jgi:alkylhydroperoxidase/carboxymuconolactone decarboxylase family protein YurZ